MFNHRLTRLLRICTRTSSEAEGELLQLEGRVERVLHFWVLVGRHFIKNRCLVRASALAFTTLLAIIPLLAVAVAITSSLLKSEGEDQIYHAIDRVVSSLVPPATLVATNGQVVVLPRHERGAATNAATNAVAAPVVAQTGPVAAPGSGPAQPPGLVPVAGGASAPGDSRMMTAQRQAARSIHSYIQNAQSGQLGIMGMVLFIFTAVGMLRGVESTFNDIWGVTVGRQWWHQLSSYFTIVALGPVALIAAATLAGGLSLHDADHVVGRIPGLSRVLLAGGPLVLLWVVFAFFYMLVPNTQVKFSAALFGGFVAGSLWHLNNVFAFLFVSRVVTDSAIYGALGLVPVIMLGLYFSWAILLFGAQVAYAFQNRAAYLQDRLAENVNQRGREFVALRIMTLLGQRFELGLPPAPVAELSAELGVPSRLTQRVLRVLTDARLVTEAAGEGHAFLPARPLESINAHHVLQALRSGSGPDLLVADSAARAGIYGDFAGIEAAERLAAEKISLQALVRRLPAPVTLLAPSAAGPSLPPPADGRAEHVTLAPDAPAGTSSAAPAPARLPVAGPAATPAAAESTTLSPAKPAPEPGQPAGGNAAPAPAPDPREVVQPLETEFPL